MDYTVTIQEETEKVTQAVVHKSVEIIEGQYGHYIYKKDEDLVDRSTKNESSM